MPLVEIKGLDDYPEEIADIFESALKESIASDPILEISKNDVFVHNPIEGVIRNGEDVVVEIRCDRKPERTQKVLNALAKRATKTVLEYFPDSKKISTFVFFLEPGYGYDSFTAEEKKD